MSLTNDLPVSSHCCVQTDSNDKTTGNDLHGVSMIRLQIGPVQDFISQAQSTRDLWSGSCLLSLFMATAIAELLSRLEAHGLNASDARACLVFPHLDSDPRRQHPLIEIARSRTIDAARRDARCLTPSLPNILVAIVPKDSAPHLVTETCRAIRKTWTDIAEACWETLLKEELVNADARDRFNHQIRRFLSVGWQITPFSGDYGTTSTANAAQLDAVRQTRGFDGWSSGAWRTDTLNEKDSLTGREEAICGGGDWWDRHVDAGRQPELWRCVFRKRQKGAYYGATTLVKRIWHRPGVYLDRSIDVARLLPVPSTWQVANHDFAKDGDTSPEDPTDDDKRYLAVLAMDGDQIGVWLSGEKNLLLSEEAHRQFSAALGHFALVEAHPIVAKHLGCLIYAGGDDVLALLPADKAVACASELRSKFTNVLQAKIPANCLKPGTTLDLDASVGIAIAHFTVPLQDVVRAAQAAERRAKRARENGGFGRAAVAVTLFKRSGGITHWGCRWTDQGLGLFDSVLTPILEGIFSAKLPHRIIELLQPYLIDSSPLVAEIGTMVDDPSFELHFDKIVVQECTHALSRQHGPRWQDGPQGVARIEALTTKLRNYLVTLDAIEAGQPKLRAKEKLRRLIGLFTAVAFAARTSDTDSPDPSERSRP